MNNSYRFDKRTKNQFISDIKNNSIFELQIAIRYCIYLHEINRKWPTLEPSGVDFTGKFINDSKKINSFPDFIINGIPTEITRADTICREVFHQKINKIRNCIDNNYNLIFVNGFQKRQEPKFISLDSNSILKFSKEAEESYGIVKHPGGGNIGLINKSAYRYNISWFKWELLPELEVNIIPERYKQLLGEVCQSQ